MNVIRGCFSNRVEGYASYSWLGRMQSILRIQLDDREHSTGLIGVGRCDSVTIGRVGFSAFNNTYVNRTFECNGFTYPEKCSWGLS